MTIRVLNFLLLLFFIGCENKIIDENEYILEDRIDVPETLPQYNYQTDTLNWENLMYYEMMGVTKQDGLFYNTKIKTPIQIEKKTKYYVFHCTATPRGRNLQPNWFLNFFLSPKPKGRGWSRPGYTEILTLDGIWHQIYKNNYDGFTAYDEMTYGVRGINSISMHFAYVGGTDRSLKSENTLTSAQKRAIRDKILHIRCFDPFAEIIFGHRDAINEITKGSHKDCPSFNFREEFKDILQ